MNNDFYLAYGAMLMATVTIYAIVNHVATAMNLPPLIQTYLAIGVALASAAYFQKYLARR